MQGQTSGGNPFGGGSQTQTTTALALPGQTQNLGVALQLPNGATIRVASESDGQLLKAWWQQQQQQTSLSMGGATSSSSGASTPSSTSGWLRTGANAADAVAGFLNGRNVRRKLEDLEDALADSRDARSELDNLERGGKYADLVPTLRRLFLAERDATEASVSVLEDQLTAVDIQTGSGVAKVAADLMGSAGPILGGEGGGIGTAVAVGAAGLGVGLLLSNDRNSERRSRRRAPR
jgi:hypothetical protein